jgi:ABC-type branched-subunit amino acid transport system ATPase component
MPMVEGKGLTKYFGGVVAVSNVDFVVEQGLQEGSGKNLSDR